MALEAGVTGVDDVMVATGDMVTDADLAGTWVPLPQALLALDISERTLWRRVKGGKLLTRVKDRRSEFFVAVAPVTGTPAEPSSSLMIAASSSLMIPEGQLDIARLEQALEQALGPLNDAFERQAARVTELERENAVLAERVAQAERRHWLSRWLDRSL